MQLFAEYILQIFGAMFMPLLIWTIKFVGREDIDTIEVNEEKANNSFNNKIVPTDATINSPLDQKTFVQKGKSSHLYEAPYLFYTAPIIKFSYDIVSVYIAFKNIAVLF